jgi:hypothetical protein
MAGLAHVIVATARLIRTAFLLDDEKLRTISKSQ